MSMVVSPNRLNPLLTPRLNGARRELLAALADAIAKTDIYRDQAEALLSGMVCDIWNEAEILAKRVPRPPVGRTPGRSR